MSSHDANSPQSRPPGDGSSAATSLSLLQRARTGEPEAWRRLFELYRPLVTHWCLRWGVPDGDADDVLQEVFRAAAQGLAAFRRERANDSFRGWLCGITRHKILAYREHRRKSPQAKGGTTVLRQLHAVPAADDDPPLGDATAADPADADAVAALFRRAVTLVRDEFETATWTAFWRTAVDGVAARDVATELGTTPAAVRMAKSRVLRRLRQEVGDLLED